MIIYKVTIEHQDMLPNDFNFYIVSEEYFDSEEKAKEYQKHKKEQYKAFNDEHYYDEGQYEQYIVTFEKIIVQ